jgi:hypothetical protein
VHKLAPRSVACVLLGLSQDHRGWYCWYDPSTHRVIISRHVYFDENVFPFRALTAAPAADPTNAQSPDATPAPCVPIAWTPGAANTVPPPLSPTARTQGPTASRNNGDEQWRRTPWPQRWHVCWRLYFTRLGKLQRWSSPAFIHLGIVYTGALPPFTDDPCNLTLTGTSSPHAHDLANMHATNSYTTIRIPCSATSP